ncbi:SIR2 family protein [Actinobacillus equuli subsp. haemolyticus]|uniref:SIR2 family protein n=1 Tax=Actinobacillus equuli TaxID=718 RepID=UPI0024467145|nr:SIR2 family protein [Actinobacillus equuli]WGE50539.1 SIR2 family protein [Actinobacillus equuli subsp. haemolyticus]
MNIQEKLSNILQSHIGGAFLFIGSGFSRRYLGLDTWEGLLTRFCNTGKPFTYYKSSAGGDLAKAAELLAKDFHEVWWKDTTYAENRKQYESFIKDTTSALRIEISHYLKNLTIDINSEYQSELASLKDLNVDGIITTNWDTFLEQLYPDYKTYIGQQELLFSNPQEIGEIYKIHGSATNPNSLILTESDYKKFDDRNAYLASKLITIFMEHPIIFIGYSLNDKNIKSLLASIVRCVDDHNLDKLRKNLIFINRLKAEESESISETSIVFDHTSLPITLIKTNNFSSIYNAIRSMKRKLPARILRHFKEQFYEFVYTSEPTEHILVSGIDNIKDHKNIDFVVGVGVKQIFSEQGYSAIKVHDLIDDLLSENRNFNAEKILNTVLMNLAQGSNQYVPIYYYLHKNNIQTEAQYVNYKKKNNIYRIDRFIKNIKQLQNKGYKNQFDKLSNKSLDYIINNIDKDKAIFYIPFLDKKDIDLDKLKDFLVKHTPHYISGKSNYSTTFRKLIALYDKYKWGW